MFYFISFVRNNKRVNRCLIIFPVETLNGFLNNKRGIFWKIQSNDEIASFQIIIKIINCNISNGIFKVNDICGTYYVTEAVR